MENNRIRVLVTGSNGQLGSEIKTLTPSYPHLDFIFTDVEELDITDSHAVNQFISINKPHFVINCAAFTAVDKAETEIEMATKINSVAPNLLAKSCKENGCKIIHISTDYVFDGESKTPYHEQSQVNPVSQYGISKLKGEQEVLLSGVGLVIRTSWLYSSFGGNFVKTIIRNGKIKPKLKVVSDQFGCPTYARDLAVAILDIASKGEDSFIPEIFHYSNEGTCSWYDFACEIIRLADIDCNVIPIGTVDYPLPAKRPQYSVFDKSKIQKSYCIEISNWKESLRDCITILKREGFVEKKDMSEKEIELQVLQKAQQWTQMPFDETTRAEVAKLIESNRKELIDAFYRELEFGTGGLRGIMGVGTNRMNIYTIGMSTQGLCNYIDKQFPNKKDISVAIAYDSRNNSKLFANTVSNIFTANNIKVYLFESLRPTPELSFTIRELKCQCGIVITASHNPKEYNGYKVYWEDGGQIVPPHDNSIIAEVQNIKDISEVKTIGNSNLIEIIGNELDEKYLNTLASLSLSSEINRKHKNLKLVYTPIHGSGVNLVPKILKRFGFENIIPIPEQNLIDGDFPTVVSPNPEESAALKLALDKAKETDADLIMATDPDADRVGIGVKDNEGKFILLNGNQAASILIYYILKMWKEKGKLNGNQYIVKTIVTTDLLADIARKFEVESFEVLTGFKYIAEKIRELEGVKTFIAGGEESYGYLVGDSIRDKDAVISCAMFAEICAWANENGKSMYQLLLEIYQEFGLYKEHLKSLTLKGKEGVEEIQAMMVRYRATPPMAIDGSPIILFHDYLKQETVNLHTGAKIKLNQPKSDVVQFIAEDGTKISVRPSGTEPKIKFYFGVKGDMKSIGDYLKANREVDDKISRIMKEFGV